MYLDLDVMGTRVKLEILGYEPPKEDLEWYEQVCYTSYNFSCEQYVDYGKLCDVLWWSCDIEYIASSIEKLLNDEFDEPQKIRFTEPDFQFVMHPKRNRWDDKDVIHTYIAPGYEIVDVCMEWKVFFNSEGCYTENYFSVCFGRKNIEYFLAYLYYAMGKYDRNTLVIKEMMENGLLVDERMWKSEIDE